MTGAQEHGRRRRRPTVRRRLSHGSRGSACWLGLGFNWHRLDLGQNSERNMNDVRHKTTKHPGHFRVGFLFTEQLQVVNEKQTSDLTCICFWPFWSRCSLWSSRGGRPRSWPPNRTLNELRGSIKKHIKLGLSITSSASPLTSLTFVRRLAGGGAPLWRLHGDLGQDSAREEREVGVKEEDNTSQLRLEWGGVRGYMVIVDDSEYSPERL